MSDATAHTRSESYSHWYLAETKITGVVTIPLREVMVLYQSGDASVAPAELYQQHLLQTAQVYASNAACPRTSSTILQAASGFIRIEVQFECAAAPPDRIQIRAMFAAAPAHVHYAKAHRNNSLVSEALVTDAADTWHIAQDEQSNALSFVAFVGIGMEHIAGGIDHIAFLLGLLLIAGSIRRSVIAVTGFTLGHSISLAAAVLGYVSADGQLVEALIGFTIMLIAVEFFVAKRADSGRIALGTMLLAWAAGLTAFALGLVSSTALIAYVGCGVFAVCYLRIAALSKEQEKQSHATILLLSTATCFGLIHGFGFAGFLMETGLLGQALVAPLLGFNLGVELGQLLFVAAALLFTTLLGKRIPGYLSQVTAAALCGLGIFWFFERTLA